MSIAAVVVAVALAHAGAFSPPPLSTVAAQVAKPVPIAGSDGNAWAKRLVTVTQPFLGAPYVLSPLGEGAGQPPDDDPRFRTDAFDCTTFVETAMAFALAADLNEGLQILDQLRYRGGHIGYAQRRHFPESEWIPDMIRAGLLVDVTRQVGGDEVVVETKHLDAKTWHRTKHKGLPTLADARIPDGTFALDVWPLDKAMAHPERIPIGTVLHLVRIDFKNVPVRVSHQGIVVEVKGQRFLRHAADRMHHRVLDEPLERFFYRMSKYGKWPVSGVHLTRFLPAADWRLRLQVEQGAPLLPEAPPEAFVAPSIDPLSTDDPASIPVVPVGD